MFKKYNEKFCPISYYYYYFYNYRVLCVVWLPVEMLPYLQ
jgi:hypothetical protein